ncbi:reverse transcriptase domain-containing protein [Caerostris extrusa]|uniref:Reverse transcriptase domain-containing protein n=1 Tax=Caerostris extrusa TaxID=172846 RepID=A0AAV4MAK2_CAEEX|nr:reverse transcriptase domain-containing protein [Caerostris extrusa]
MQELTTAISESSLNKYPGPDGVHGTNDQEQFGFREGHSTTDQVLYFCQRVRDAHNRSPQITLWQPSLIFLKPSTWSGYSALRRSSPKGVKWVFFADDVVMWDSGTDLQKLEDNLNSTLEDLWKFAENHKLSFNPTKSTTHPGICNFCCASNTNLQKLDRVQLSAARVITGLRNTCPNDRVLYEADLQPLSLRRCLFGEILWQTM